MSRRSGRRGPYLNLIAAIAVAALPVLCAQAAKVGQGISLIPDSPAVKTGKSTILRLSFEDSPQPSWTYEWSVDRATLKSFFISAYYTATEDLSPGWDVVTVRIKDAAGEVVSEQHAVILVYRQFVILKADDFGCWGTLSPGWLHYLAYIIDTKRLKTSAGVITRFLDPEWNNFPGYAPYVELIKSTKGTGFIEYWNHGYDHSCGDDWREFYHTSFEFQKSHLEKGQQLARSILGFPFTAFGAPFNSVDSTTSAVVSESEDLKVWFLGISDAGRTILYAGGGLVEPKESGFPDFAGFLATHDWSQPYVVLQHHPGRDSFLEHFDQFEQIIDHLVSGGATFIQPTEFYNLGYRHIFPLHPQADSDGDGMPDIAEGHTDTDHDGLPNFLETDSDADGMGDAEEGNVDHDSDGLPDYVDTDSDGDGHPDSWEGAQDYDGDGVPRYLDWDEPPAILYHPQSQSVDPLAMVMLEVCAVGTPPLSYRWKKNGEVVNDWCGAFFFLPAVMDSDEGTYTCDVGNAGGWSESQACEIQVNDAPVIITEPESMCVHARNAARFMIEVQGTPPFRFEWRKDGVPIAGATAPDYFISEVEQADEGHYSCYVSNSAGTALGANVVSANAILTIGGCGPPLTLVRQPAGGVGLVGKSFSFSSEATGGHPPLSYLWRKAGCPEVLCLDPEYTILRVDIDDAGQYYVSVEDSDGQRVESDPAELDPVSMPLSWVAVMMTAAALWGVGARFAKKKA